MRRKPKNIRDIKIPPPPKSNDDLRLKLESAGKKNLKKPVRLIPVPRLNSRKGSKRAKQMAGAAILGKRSGEKAGPQDKKKAKQSNTISTKNILFMRPFFGSPGGR